MLKKTLLFAFASIFAALILFSVGSSSSIEAQDDAPEIRLAGYAFSPAKNERPNVPPGLAVSTLAQNSKGYYIVQFAGPVQAHWKDAVTAAGADLLDYIPDFAFKARMNPAQAAQVAQLDEVSYVGLFQPAFKLSTDLLEGPGLYRIRVERGSDAGQARAAIAQSGATVLGRDGQYIVVGAETDQIEAIAQVTDVAWVENFDLKETHNDSGAGVIIGGNTANANGYDGSSQIAAVADTGLGDGTTSGAHRDIEANRVVSVYSWAGVTDICFETIIDDGAIDVDSAHGTHVAGSVLSSGDPVTGLGKGTAPAAGLVFQATENFALISNYCQVLGGFPPNGYFLTGLPEDLNNLYQQAYDDGARVHANSWGSSQAGVYTANSAQTDEFIWNNPDMSITFSAGNDGVDANSNGVVDNDSIGSPATAKNTITVGASENERPDNFPCDTSLSYTSSDAYQSGQTCNSMGGENMLGTAGARWGFTTEPLNSDLSGGNMEQMAPFSSRGPTDDGRIKPDIVAPGTWILSTFSDLYQQEYDSTTNPQSGAPATQYDGWGMPYNAFYKYMGGTSMSNPIAAGGATVVRDYYNKAHGVNASAALVKATMINSAVDLLDENNDGQNDNDFPIPNMHEGWGRIDVAKATDGSLLFVDNSSGMTTGNTTNYQYNVSTAGSVFKVTLVWSDYPSTEAATSNLVNDLDLVVTAPDGTQYRGNVFSNGWSQAGGNTDRVNNVENVYIQAAAAGTWSVDINGYNVPNGPQPFAIVVDGTFGPPVPTATPTNTAIPTNTPPPTNTPIPTNTPEPASSMHVGDIDGAASSSGRNWSGQATITVHDANENPVSGATVSGAWSGDTSGTGSCTTNGSGVCSISSNSIRKNSSNSMIFTVTGVSHASLNYSSGDNHDPDGSSNGFAIQINKDGTTTNPGAPTATPPPTSTPSATATPGATTDVHAGDVIGSSSAGSRNRWNASVTITVHDASHASVSGATVSGSWSNGTTGGASCTTNGSGQCTVSKSNLKGNVGSVTFTVTSISGTGLSYDSGANEATSTTVTQP